MGNRVEIVVPSCWGYRDAWGPFSALLKRFWKDHPRYTLITDRYDSPNGWEGDIINLGRDYGWAKNLANGITIRSEFYILMQEDFFINDEVDHERIVALVEWMESDREIACTRLMPCPGPDTPYSEVVGLIDLRAPYRVSCQAAIWRRDSLLEILSRPEIQSAADFEILGTMGKPPGIYASVPVGNPAIPYLVSAIGRGKWSQDAVKLCNRLGVPIDLSMRPVER